jgi:Tol biopolymer transport system component
METSGTAVPILDDVAFRKNPQIPWSLTPDGQRLAYAETTPRRQIWTVPLDPQASQLKAGTPEQFLKSNFQDSGPLFSIDGRSLACYSNESGRSEVYVRAVPPPSSGQGGKRQVSNNGGYEPHRSRTGRELVYLPGDQVRAVSYSVNGDAFVADTPRVWIPALGGAETSGANWDLAPDGKRVAVRVSQVPAQAPQKDHEIGMLQNFVDELRRRAPVAK